MEEEGFKCSWLSKYSLKKRCFALPHSSACSSGLLLPLPSTCTKQAVSFGGRFWGMGKELRFTYERKGWFLRGWQRAYKGSLRIATCLAAGWIKTVTKSPWKAPQMLELRGKTDHLCPKCTVCRMRSLTFEEAKKTPEPRKRGWKLMLTKRDFLPCLKGMRRAPLFWTLFFVENLLLFPAEKGQASGHTVIAVLPSEAPRVCPSIRMLLDPLCSEMSQPQL